MPTPRKPTAPTAEAIDQFCACFDALFPRREERQAFRHSLMGLLLPREHNLTLVELAALVPGPSANGYITSCMMPASDVEAVNGQRLKLWQAHP